MADVFGREIQDHRRSHRADAGDEFLTIGQMSRLFEVSLRALRFYEDRGLLCPVRHGTMRLYDSRQKMRLEMILKGKRLGFTLTEIRDMVATGPREEPAEIDQALAPAQIVSQISELERQREMIDQAIRELRATHERVMGAPAERSHNAA